MISGAIPTDIPFVHGYAKIVMWDYYDPDPVRHTILIDNAFQSSGYSYLRDCLAYGTLAAVSDMVLIHTTGSNTVETSNTVPTYNTSRFIAGWGPGIEYTITSFELRSSFDVTYSKFAVSIYKPTSYTLNVEWNVIIS